MSKNPSSHYDELEIASQLALYDSYIVALAWRYIPRSWIAREVLDMDVDELAQTTRIRLWNALRTRYIRDLKAYIRIIVRHGAVDLIRKSRYNASSLALNDDGELLEGTPVAIGHISQDPAVVVEEAEAVADCTSKATDHILALPPKQQCAVACALKDHVSENHIRERIAYMLPLIEGLNKHGLHIKDASWPQNEKGQQQFRASLFVARKKLKSMIA